MQFKSKKFSVLLATVFALAVSFQTAQAASYSVPPGCELPPSTAGRTFYVDPIKGSMNGDGSAAKPWKTLSEVVAAKLITSIDARGKVLNPKGVVAPGDKIYLRTGHHGSVGMSGYLNSKFITIAAEPGQKPVLQSLTMSGGTRWVFEGLTFEDGHFKIRGAPGTFWGPSDNVIFNSNKIVWAKGGDKFTPEQWRARQKIAALWAEGTCLSVTNNEVLFSRDGLSIGGNKVLVKNNKVDFFTDDGIRFYADNLTLQGNTVTDHYGKLSGNTNHLDGIQGWIFDKVGTNLVVDSNIVIEKTGKYAEIPPFAIGTPPGPADFIQGISVFDGIWKNAKITNNVVAVSAGHGLTFYGLDGGLVANNTVVSSTLTPIRYSYPWIGVFARKDGTPSENIIIRNNIGNFFAGGVNKYMKATSPSFTADHNIAIVKGTPAKDLFMQYDPSTATYDLRLKPGSKAIGAGTPEHAPETDITGTLRGGSVDLGAYAFKTQTGSPRPAPTASFSGTLTFKANSRQAGAPKLVVQVNGQDVGMVPVTANISAGKTAVYSLPFDAKGKPQTLSVRMEGFTGNPKSVNMGLFSLSLKVGDTTYNLMSRTGGSNITFNANGVSRDINIADVVIK